MLGSRMGPVHRLYSTQHLPHGRNTFIVPPKNESPRFGWLAAAVEHQLEPQQQQQQQQQQRFPSLCLDGRAVAISWDLDNVAPSSLQLDLVPAVQELQTLLTYLGGCVSHTTLYANPATCSRLGPNTVGQLGAAAVQLVQVPPRKQSADMQLTADACAFARQQQQRGCVVCVSGDRGFAPILSYVAGQGATAISIFFVPSQKRLPGLLPELRQQLLAQASHAVFAWQPAAGTAARKCLQQQQQQATDPLLYGSWKQPPSSSSSSGVVTTSAGRVLPPGSGWYAVPAAAAAAAAASQVDLSAQFIEAVWINPSKAVQLTQQRQQQQQQ